MTLRSHGLALRAVRRRENCQAQSIREASALQKGQNIPAGTEGPIFVFFRGHGMKRCLADRRQRFELWVGYNLLRSRGQGPRGIVPSFGQITGVSRGSPTAPSKKRKSQPAQTSEGILCSASVTDVCSLESNSRFRHKRNPPPTRPRASRLREDGSGTAETSEKALSIWPPGKSLVQAEVKHLRKMLSPTSAYLYVDAAEMASANLESGKSAVNMASGPDHWKTVVPLLSATPAKVKLLPINPWGSKDMFDTDSDAES